MCAAVLCKERISVFATGFQNTILITLVSLVVGLVFGILIAMIRYGFTQMRKKRLLPGMESFFIGCTGS